MKDLVIQFGNFSTKYSIDQQQNIHSLFSFCSFKNDQRFQLQESKDIEFFVDPFQEQNNITVFNIFQGKNLSKEIIYDFLDKIFRNKITEKISKTYMIISSQENKEKLKLISWYILEKQITQKISFLKESDLLLNHYQIKSGVVCIFGYKQTSFSFYIANRKISYDQVCDFGVINIQCLIKDFIWQKGFNIQTSILNVIANDILQNFTNSFEEQILYPLPNGDTININPLFQIIKEEMFETKVNKAFFSGVFNQINSQLNSLNFQQKNLIKQNIIFQGGIFNNKSLRDLFLQKATENDFKSIHVKENQNEIAQFSFNSEALKNVKEISIYDIKGDADKILYEIL